MSDFVSSKAAWLVAGFLGRKFMKDIFGRWSFIPVLALGLCIWTTWMTRHREEKAAQGKLEQLRRQTRQQLRLIRRKTATGLLTRGGSGSTSPSSLALPSTKAAGAWTGEGRPKRRSGDRLGGTPNGTASLSLKHMSPTAAANGGTAPAVPKDALASELWAWLGGVGVGRVCGTDRPKRASRGSEEAGEGGRGEWQGAFTNRMGNLPRRNAFKTARGKVYLRNGPRRPGWARSGQPEASVGVLESVREEDEATLL